VSDLDALDTCERFLIDHRILVEPACGASLAAVYNAEPGTLQDFVTPLVVVCGRATATVVQLGSWRQRPGIQPGS